MNMFTVRSMLKDIERYAEQGHHALAEATIEHLLKMFQDERHIEIKPYIRQTKAPA